MGDYCVLYTGGADCRARHCTVCAQKTHATQVCCIVCLPIS
jgi:hypothetical protein